MKVTPDIKVRPGDDKKGGPKIKEWYVGVKATMTFEEIGKMFRKIGGIFRRRGKP